MACRQDRSSASFMFVIDNDWVNWLAINFESDL